jgi:hypothetical protein
VSGLRPWEWAAMDAHDYYRIIEIRHAWEQGRQDYRAEQAELKRQREQAELKRQREQAG